MKKTEKIAVFGSTGSIGTQTLAVAEHLHLSVDALVARKNVTLLETQARKFHPRYVALAEEAAARDLKIRLSDTDICVLSGREGIKEAANLSDADTAVTAMEGISGLEPTLAAIEAGKKIALANKETLVCAGRLVFAKAKQQGVEIIPVDSEHAAIAQCLESKGCGAGSVNRILLTASGGPFFGFSADKLALVSAKDALKHPNWNMGSKITVDSASMMNKGLELIEAMHLFHISPERIQVLIHRESIIHSMVEFVDRSVVAQLGVPDMKLPIQYALTWPERTESITEPVDFCRLGSLHFAPPDEENFPCLPLARQVASMPSSAAVAMNGGNEEAVGAFLRGEISFPEIPEVCRYAVLNTDMFECEDLPSVCEVNLSSRGLARAYIRRLSERKVFN